MTTSRTDPSRQAPATDSGSRPEAPARETHRDGARRLVRKPIVRLVLMVYAVIVLLLLLGRFLNPSFGSAGFVWVVLSVATITAIVGSGQGIAVLTGGLDLSIPSVVALSGILLTGVSLGRDDRLPQAALFIVLAAAGVGLVNGLGIVKLRISPVIMTLATNVILGGLILVLTAGTPKGTAPPAVRDFVGGGLWGIPSLVLFLLAFTAVAVLLMNGTVLGRYLYAVGTNAEAARLSGVPVQAVIVAAYVISSLAAAVAAVLLVGQGGSSYLGMGDPYLLLSLGAVVIGGASITGGRGLYLGTVGGAVLLTLISIFLAATTLPDATRQIIFAATIVVAVLAARKYQ
ncbi:MAG: ABC transporter permease [Actinomycetota bacterium]|nr:ABC transporter permease [Actinomycetota bacterium]